MNLIKKIWYRIWYYFIITKDGNDFHFNLEDHPYVLVFQKEITESILSNYFNENKKNIAFIDHIELLVGDFKNYKPLEKSCIVVFNKKGSYKILLHTNNGLKLLDDYEVLEYIHYKRNHNESFNHDFYILESL